MRHILLATFLLIATFSKAAITTWTGAGDGINWHDPSNWDTGARPTIFDDVRIYTSGVTVYVIFNSAAATLDMQNGVTLIIDVDKDLFINGEGSGLIDADGIYMDASANTLRNFGNLTVLTSDEHGIHMINSRLFNEGTIDIIGYAQELDPGRHGIFATNNSMIENKRTLKITSNVSVSNTDGIGLFAGSLFMNTSASSLTIMDINGPSSDGITNHSTFENLGTITINPVLVNYGIFNNTNLAKFINSGTITITNDPSKPGIVNQNSAVYGGSGMVTLDDFNNNAIIAPGLSPGAISIVGNYNESSAAIYEVEIDGISGAGAPSGHDLIHVNGDVNLAGTLDVKLTSIFSLSSADTFNVLTYTGVLSGTYSSINLPSPEMDGWGVDYGIIKPGEIIVYQVTALPVNLLSFEAYNQGAHEVVLSWKTENEINNAGFEIEHSSNGASWKSIGWVASQVELARSNTYSFNHQIVAKNNYYRLKQIDKDGAYEYSRIITHVNTYDEVQIYPNPFQNELTIDIPNENVEVDLFNIKGELLYQTRQEGSSTIDVSSFGSGTYYINIRAGKKLYTKQILKIR